MSKNDQRSNLVKIVMKEIADYPFLNGYQIKPQPMNRSGSRERNIVSKI